LLYVANKLEDARLSFELSDITDVYMGKQTGILNHTACNGIAEHCFTIATRRGLQLDLEAEDGDTVTTWLEAISQLLTEAPSPAPSSSSPATSSDSKLPPVPQSPVAITPSPQTTIAILTNGETFAAYEQDRSGRVVRKAIYLFYRQHGRDGPGLYWCEPGRHDEVIGQSLPFAALTDVWVGKLTPILKAPIAAESPENLCFSLVGKKTLNLAATSLEQLRTWLAGISQLVSGTGHTVVLEQTQGKPKEERRYSITQPAAGSIPDTVHHRRLAAGLNVTLFDTNNQRVQPERRPAMRVFYRPAKGPVATRGMGTLYWCGIGRADELPNQSLPFESITDIYIGKQHKTWSSPVTSDARGERCFSILGEPNELHCEATSAAEMNEFLVAFKTIITSGGKEVVDTSINSDGSSAAGANTARAGDDVKRRMSFRPGQDKSPLNAGASPISAASLDEKRPGPDPHTPAEAVKMMSNGRHVTKWTENGPEEVFLFWKPAIGSGKSGTLYWNDPTGK
jgi:hypothetical protein